MKHKTIIEKLILLIFVSFFMMSCSNDNSIINGEDKQEEVAFIVKTSDDLNALLNGINYNAMNEEIENELVSTNKMQTRVSIVPMFVGGYDLMTPYSGKDGILFITKDAPLANKLGIKFNHSYNLTIYQVNKKITSNGFNPSITESPYCGLMLNDKMDDFLTCNRGYRGFYYTSTKIYSMNTSLMCFKDRSAPGGFVWYPCTPDGLEWRFNAVWK